MKHFSSLSFFILALLTCACATRRAAQQPQMVADAAPVETSVAMAAETPAPDSALAPAQTASAQTAPAPRSADDALRAKLHALCLGDSLTMVSQMGVCVFDLTNGMPLFNLNAAHRMRPASCQKLVTAIAALCTLGPGHTFTTAICRDEATNNLYVNAAADPLLSTAELSQAATQLKLMGVHRVGKLCKDLSLYGGKRKGWGWCWDDDDETLTPLLVDGKSNKHTAFARALTKQGITHHGPDTLLAAACPPHAKALVQITHSLPQLLHQMMKESDNTYAECLFMQLAAQGGRKHATRTDAVEIIRQVAAAAGISTEAITIADGSGLSLYNYLTPQFLTQLLCMAHSRPDVFDALKASLPIAGVDGTLEKRMAGTAAQERVWAKTGTVTGVSSLAGYLQTANGRLLAFAIINQGVARAAHARAFQDRLCEILCE